MCSNAVTYNFNVFQFFLLVDFQSIEISICSIFFLLFPRRYLVVVGNVWCVQLCVNWSRYICIVQNRQSLHTEKENNNNNNNNSNKK